MIIRKLFIILLHQQFLCHGGWALRPSSELPPPTPSSGSSNSSAPLFDTSTLQDNQTLNYESLQLAASQTPFVPATNYNEQQSTTFKSSKNSPPKSEIVSIETNCTRDLFELRIHLNKQFRGILFAKDFPDECRTRGNRHANVTLKLPTSGCGVRSEPQPDGDIELSVRVMLQMDGKLRQSTDIVRTVRCIIPQNMMNMNVMASGEMKRIFRNGRMRPTATDTESPLLQHSSSSSPPRVRIWLELGGPDGSGSVEVGQATTLAVRAVVPGTMGVRVVDCAALDGLGESSQQLLDERGCPIDEQVMPALHTRFRPAEEGWSKPHEDDLVEKLYTATFPAFKFPDRERLHVSCGVQLCRGNCPNINCRRGDKLILPSDKHLARIEVFNSLAVTAPQIEIDRLRYDRRYNSSVEEYPPKIRTIHSEGTLCLSISKLAISFCILGLIFLVAVVVSVCCMIRSRRRHHCSDSQRASSTSMFSSSSESAHSARFGSKLFIPYYPAGTLPYGRVY